MTAVKKWDGAQWVTLSGSTSGTNPVVSPLLVPRDGCWWGAYTGGSDAGDSAFETLIGRKLDVVSTYYGIGATGPTADETTRLAKGRIPLIDVSTKNFSTGAFQPWSDIAAGTYDTFWQGWGTKLGALPGKVYFSFDQEASTKIQQWPLPDKTPSDYVAAFQRVRNIIAARASNAVFVYWASGSDAALDASLYPGDSTVDWIGLDPYKWSSHPASETPLQTWSAAWSKVTYGAGKPRALFETGCDASTFESGSYNCAQWWADTAAAASNLGLKMVVFYDRVQWQIDSNASQVAAYAAAGAAPLFNNPHA